MHTPEKFFGRLELRTAHTIVLCIIGVDFTPLCALKWKISSKNGLSYSNHFPNRRGAGLECRYLAAFII